MTTFFVTSLTTDFEYESLRKACEVCWMMHNSSSENHWKVETESGAILEFAADWVDFQSFYDACLREWAEVQKYEK